ncbi:hypothetical protein CISIN_1g037280mg [Citrus sinensis]|uniref:FBD domain-containing protein n=1 Tax=Citrus sinensis TaxID=2711 RepID=A0A067G7X1_CITSI|nr:hypothetical protein CISIN_1g037280mg [Citrus sinensis]
MITDGRDLPAITCLLESSPVLEKLTLIMKPSDIRRNIEIIESQPRFAGSNFFCSLVEFLLKNAKVLEKMAIHVGNDYFDGSWEKSITMKQKLSDLFDMNHQLSNYPRASPNALFLLKNPFKILDLKFCDFQPVVCVSWPKLNVLTIGYVNQSNEIIAQSLSGSPMLEFSRLQGCNGINPLIVISSNFKELLIDGPRESFSSTWFVMAILTPN